MSSEVLKIPASVVPTLDLWRRAMVEVLAENGKVEIIQDVPENAR